jgi:hypothetical protein
MELSFFFVAVFQPRSYVAFTREEQELRRMSSSRRCVPCQPEVLGFSSVSLVSTGPKNQCLLVGFIIVHT